MYLLSESHLKDVKEIKDAEMPRIWDNSEMSLKLD